LVRRLAWLFRRIANCIVTLARKLRVKSPFTRNHRLTLRQIGKDPPMKSLKLAAAALALVAPLAMAQTSTWKSDPAHSEVDFTIKHLAVSNVHGRFGHVDATIVLDEKDISKSTVNATIDVAGLSTGEAARDNHLKTPDFFDASQYASATFVSTSVARGGSGLKVSGNLTLHGVTKPVVLDVDGPSAPVPDMRTKKPHVGFSATTTINRLDFGIGPKFAAAMLSEDVKISIDIDAVQQ
jgi:polyisoprenoid-binding protein YceI